MSQPASESTAKPPPREVAALLERIPCTAGTPRTVAELPGGLTNYNLKVTTPAGVVVARIFASNAGLLSIDRDHEYANSVAAASTGVGAPVIDYRPDDGVLVVGYIAGRTLTDDDLADPAQLARVADACRVLHAGPRFGNDFDMFATQRRYLDIVRAHGFRLPQGYLDFLPEVERIREALQANPLPTVPCNNDLLAGNLIDDGDRIRIIDYEYAGNNDPCFELGNIWSEASLPLDHLTELVTRYFGGPRPSMVARARLLGLMSKYGWTLWASIQDGDRGSSTEDGGFDFWSWGMEKYDRAVAEFRSPDFDHLLADVHEKN